MALMPNGTLVLVVAEAGIDESGFPSGTAGATKWTGSVPCQVRDRSVRTSDGVRVNRVHQTEVWLPARLVAAGGGYLALAIGDTLAIIMDGQTLTYEVRDWEDPADRRVGNPPPIHVYVERTAA